MSVFQKLRNRRLDDISSAVIAPEEEKVVVSDPEGKEAALDDSISEVSSDAPEGVQAIEGALMVWPKWAVYTTYAWIWVCYFMLALQQTIGTTMMPYAYASFIAAPAVSTANILATIIGGVLKLPIGKMLNIWGRAEGFVVFVGVYLLGLIILAACNNQHAYAAGYVLYWIGYDAIYLILNIFIADTCGLRNRAFAFAFASTPFICTAFTGSLAAESILKTATWRWGFGIFTIVMPFVFLPLAGVFKYYHIKAVKLGVVKPRNSGRTYWQSIQHYFHEFDIVGAFILMAAFVLLLLPFSLQTYGRATYHSAKFIAMIIIGGCLFPVFAAWEKWGAKVHFIKYELFRDPTVIGACILAAVNNISFYCWDLYYYNFVLIVYNLSVRDAGYMLEIFNVGSCFWSPIFGLYVRITKHFKYACLFFALPLQILGCGLLIHFRGEYTSNIGYIIMCQIFIAFAGGMLVIGEEMAVMAASDKEGIPMMLSLVSLFSSVGSSIGYAISAAVYDNTFYDALSKKLSASEASSIYLGGVTAQSSYPVGSTTRDAIIYAWNYSQKYSSVAATAILALSIPSIAVWKNFNVDQKRNKGHVM
ncbi:hypothetical protein OGAPHI_006324 [Ogataea philodendri]|uniref:Siderochrome-iron transporter n=1 Tax=Ogataea philodendri TaxID=1378263 RepID=A0A9P8NXW7_9ASCO|nr:uncharacterized protein OGAPHI_006324 [Ogataea philodendri]KAH3661477.1 hypothetical protein OGAPHI_006324 [Ogataea philodendri]